MHTDSTDIVETPCVGICRIEGKHCAGCLRTIREIGAWSSMNPADRRAVIAQLAGRRQSDEKP